jgi:two-component system nitrogen regulation sensor histidine kinase NtrY
VPQDLNAVLEEALVLFREGHPRIAFTFEAAPDLPRLGMDREGVKRAVINLLDNAVSACAARPPTSPEERRHVRLRTTWDHRLDVARVEIADDGVGMKPETKARLFEPYFSTKPDGTGLGLAIVSAIVADHKGFIRVRDERPHGTRFVIELPIGSAPAERALRARRGAWSA